MSDGTLDGAGWTTDSGLTLLPTDAEFLSALPFTIADIESGSTEFTHSNEVEVVDFPIPEGYDRYQINPHDGPDMLGSNSWTATTMPPQTVSFDLPVADTTNVILYAWFTNSTETVTLRRAAATITFTRISPQPATSFSGSDSYIDLGAPGALQIPSNEPFTVEGWIYLNARSTRDMLLCKNNNRSSPYTYMLGFADGGKLAAYDGSTWRYASPAVYSLEQQWMHLAFSFDGTTMSFYFNGALKGTAPYSFINDPSHTVKIGGFNTAADIDGLISDVRIWNHARNAAQIQAAMQHRLSGNETGLRGYWPLFENEGSQVRDYSLFANHGELIGAGWVESQTLGLVLQADAFLLARPFGLANPTTGSTEFTNSNEVDVVNFAIPAGYDHYQINQNGDSAAITSNNWTATNDLPDQLTFDLPATDSNIVFYAWFTNMAESVTVARAAAGIHYSKVNPVSIARATHSRKLIPGQPVVLQAAEIDTGSSGGETGGLSIPIHALSLNLVSGPDTNATPQAPAVTVAALGSYEVELVVMNAAGNVATSSVCQVAVTAYGGEPFVWTGAADDDWFNPLNWDLNAVPIAGSEVFIGAGGAPRLAGPTPALDSLTLTGGTLAFENWDTRLDADTVLIENGGMTISAAFENETMSNRVWIVCGTFDLRAGAAINVDGKGYRGGVIGERGHGPGGGGPDGTGAGGGGHGGIGGRGYLSNSGPSYGIRHAPDTPGSGGGGGGTAYGGIGGNGGGAVRIEASGHARLDGTISANATEATYRAGGGSGGGIWITCGTFSGTGGVVRAEGSRAPSHGGGGGGGRIALQITDPATQAGMVPHRVIFSAEPGTSVSQDAGEIGTLYLSHLLLLDGAWVPHSGTLCVADWNGWSPDNLHLTGWLRVAPTNTTYFTLAVAGDAVFSGADAHLELTAPQFSVGGDMILTNGARLTLQAVATNFPASVSGSRGWLGVAGELAVAANSWIHPLSEPFTGGSLRIEAADLRIDAGGGIDADEGGFYRGVNATGYSVHGYGPGHGWAASANGSGAGYGGQGGRSLGQPLRGAIYGDPLFPLLPGSGGAGRTGYTGASGGNGGGLIDLMVRGSAMVNGALSANGQKGLTHGGGSGGAIHLQCRQFTGGTNSLMQADGGAGKGTADGGGRIAVWFGEPYTPQVAASRLVITETAPDSYAGSVSVANGSGYASETEYSEPGTVRFVRVLPMQGTLLLLR